MNYSWTLGWSPLSPVVQIPLENSCKLKYQQNYQSYQLTSSYLHMNVLFLF